MFANLMNKIVKRQIRKVKFDLYIAYNVFKSEPLRKIQTLTIIRCFNLN